MGIDYLQACTCTHIRTHTHTQFSLIKLQNMTSQGKYNVALCQPQGLALRSTSFVNEMCLPCPPYAYKCPLTKDRGQVSRGERDHLNPNHRRATRLYLQMECCQLPRQRTVGLVSFPAWKPPSRPRYLVLDTNTSVWGTSVQKPPDRGFSLPGASVAAVCIWHL